MTRVDKLSCYLNQVLILDEPYRGHTAVYIESHFSDFNNGGQLGKIGLKGFIGSNEYFEYEGLGVCSEELMRTLKIVNKKPVINRMLVHCSGKPLRWKDANTRHKYDGRRKNAE